MSDEPDQADDEFGGRPSKSERKRNAHDAQKLGEELIALEKLDLEAFGLPETLVDAIREARRLRSRGGLVRQRQYVGKLMREVDLDPIRAALAARGEHAARDTRTFKLIEHWRDRLIAEGEPALEELMKVRAGMDHAEWQTRVAAAVAERARLNASGPAARELFRALRGVLDHATMSEQ